MKEFWISIQVAFTAIGGWLGWFLGGCDGLLYALLAFVVIDYVTGVMCAVVDRRLSSAIGFRGIFKKVLINVVIAADGMLSKHGIQPTNIGPWFGDATKNTAMENVGVRRQR